jgi:hypothetical protein
MVLPALDESNLPTTRRPPFIVSVPAVLLPTVRLPEVTHVPLDTVALPTPFTKALIVVEGLVTLPPFTLSVPVPP